MIKHRYTWARDAYDPRDHVYRPANPYEALPVSVDLTPKMPPVFDQGQLGSCTANASAAALAFEHGGGPYSRLFIYYNERRIEGDVSQDAGAQVRDAVRSLRTYGAPPEVEETYLPSRFRVKPSAKDYRDALPQRITSYARITGVDAMGACLAAGFPFIFGFTVYASFESDQVAATGIVPMPQPGEQILGGHCVVATGYKWRSGLQFRCRNSWGASWGLRGDFMIPADYLANPQLASDFWTIRR